MLCISNLWLFVYKQYLIVQHKPTMYPFLCWLIFELLDYGEYSWYKHSGISFWWPYDFTFHRQFTQEWNCLLTGWEYLLLWFLALYWGTRLAPVPVDLTLSLASGVLHLWAQTHTLTHRQTHRIFFFLFFFSAHERRKETNSFLKWLYHFFSQ